VFICVHLWLNPFVSFRSSPRRLSTNQELYASSLRALMRRGHSIHEMRQYLERRAEDKELVPPVIARLRELSYLDDARYALDYARTHAKLRRQGKFRIARELRGRGVPDRHIEAALETVFAETDEASLVRTRLKRRLAHIRGPLDQRKIASIYRNLLAAGFSSDIIRAELRGVTHGELPDLPDPSEASDPADLSSL
jgi:regulatory protein